MEHISQIELTCEICVTEWRATTDPLEWEPKFRSQAMSSVTELEQRLSAVEKTVAKLEHKLDAQHLNWIEEIAGVFENEPAFAEFERYGREFRESHPYPEDVGP
jgi:hypothetical protein